MIRSFVYNLWMPKQIAACHSAVLWIAFMQKLKSRKKNKKEEGSSKKAINKMWIHFILILSGSRSR